MRQRVFWSPEDEKSLRENYPQMLTRDVASLLDRELNAVNRKAYTLGLKKTPQYLASPAAKRRFGNEPGSRATQFKKGQTPMNKGMKMPGWAPGRMASTQFKKGQRGNKYLPIGSERVNGEGYTDRKVTDKHGTPRDWKGVHVIMWEETHGPVPSGRAVIFRDRNKANIVLSNLQLVTRAELMMHNSSQRWGKEVFQAIQLRGALNRKIRRFSEKQNVGPTQPSV